MASTFVVSCPECDKQIKAPADLEGKKIRCKGCGHAFVVEAPRDKGPAKAKKKESEGVKVKSKGKSAPPAEEKGSNPYQVTDHEFAHRCPNCAFEMESEDAIICLHCGYNTMTRQRLEPVKTIEHTAVDWILWLLPGFLAILTIFAMIGTIVFMFIWLPGIIEENKDAWWAFGPRLFHLWGTIFCLFIIYFSGRFAIKRLIFHPRPPEKIKR